MAEEGPSVAELLAALDEEGGVHGDDKWKRLGIDFDQWNWWSSAPEASAHRVTPSSLDDPEVGLSKSRSIHLHNL